MICRIVSNKFDCFIVIEGNRGLGKSTLGIHIARGVSREMKKNGRKDYRFHWRNSLIYTRKETKQFLHKWNANGIADELINVAFNRDFYNEDQKDIIKLLNMCRDHCNLLIACVPSFNTLDNQIKNLCKIKITVVRRGLCIIQTPSRSIYGTDKWDQKINEKIERGWLSKGIKNPHYSKLTTFRGMLRFPKLHPTAEDKYQKVKDAKRNIVAREEMGIDAEEEKTTDPHEIMIEMLLAGSVRNGVFIDGFAQANNLKSENFRAKVVRLLKERKKPYQIKEYYWENKAKEKESGSI